MCTILNGIDVDRFCYNGPSSNGPVVTVARLSPEKDIANLVRAAQIAVRQAHDLRFEIAGGGQCHDQLTRQATELGVAEHVCFLGSVRDVPRLLSRASMFVLPSLSEGIPLTVLEAMARGLPVVATRVGGVPEVVVHGQTGLLVPSGDPAALAQAILTLRHDPSRRVAMGQNGRKTVEELFNIRRMVSDYETLYEEAGFSSDETTPHRARPSSADQMSRKNKQSRTGSA
jgi:glycosyltransferase involved in cell wall biosynthesis